MFNYFKWIFGNSKISTVVEQQKIIKFQKQNTREMLTAKDKQLAFIKSYLKPTLKELGYKTNKQTWWKDKGDFFTLINLQNFSWNSKDDVDFCFNTGICLKAKLKPSQDKPTHYDLNIYLRGGFYLPENRKEYRYKNKTGYILTSSTDLEDFTAKLKTDFEVYILPYLEKLKTLEDCITYYGEVPFWGDELKKAINEI